MAKAADEPAIPDSPMERMMRFGRALFAVRKDELPKREDRAKTKRGRKKAKPAPGA
jgi:hypothetical protein